MQWPYEVSNWNRERGSYKETIYRPREILPIDHHFGIVKTDDTATDFDSKPVLLETSYTLTEYGANLHYPACDPWHRDFMWAAVKAVNYYRLEPTKALYDVIHLDSGYVLTRLFKNKAKEFVKILWTRKVQYMGHGLFQLDTSTIQSKKQYTFVKETE